MTIFDEWQSYQRGVVPATAHHTQREECRRAFYAGAAAAFLATMKAGELDEDACVAALTELRDELRSFTKDLRL